MNTSTIGRSWRRTSTTPPPHSWNSAPSATRAADSSSTATGSFVGPSGSLGFAREAVQAERVAFAYLMHQQFGAPVAPRTVGWNRMAQGLDPVRVFPYVGMVIHHSARGVVSFSWKNHLMAQVVPQSVTHLDQPYVTTPLVETLVGGFTLAGQNASSAQTFTINTQATMPFADGFAAVVDANVNAGLLRQQMAVASVAPGVVAYVDRVTAIKAVTVNEERGMNVGIENDDVCGNTRQVQSVAGPVTIPGGQGQDHALSGRWVNIDGRFGLVSGLNAPILYRAAGATNRPGAREDYLMGSWIGGSRRFAAGAAVSQRAGLLLLDATAPETAALASGTTTSSTGGTITLRFVAPDGRAHVLSMTPAGAATWDGQTVR